MRPVFITYFITYINSSLDIRYDVFLPRRALSSALGSDAGIMSDFLGRCCAAALLFLSGFFHAILFTCFYFLSCNGEHELYPVFLVHLGGAGVVINSDYIGVGMSAS